MMTCTRRLEWDAMHRIPDHEGACAAWHGHRYVAEVTCSAESLDSVGRVIDFACIKTKVGGWIDAHWDHTAILQQGDSDPAAAQIAESNAGRGRPVYWMLSPPTAENIASELGALAAGLLKEDGITVSRVRVWETPNCSAEWMADPREVVER